MQTWLLYMALGAGVTGCDAPSAQVGQIQGRPLQLMIRLEGLAADAAPQQRQQQLDELMASSGQWAGVRLCWLRPLAVGDHVIGGEGGQGLADGQQEALVQSLSQQPGVVFVEVDGPMEIGPGPRLPSVRMQHD